MDPSDWRILDTYTEYLLLHGRQDECPKYWELALVFSPQHGLKAMLQRAKLIMFLGDGDQACEIYESHRSKYPMSTHLNNNIAICYVRQGRANMSKEYFKLALNGTSPEQIKNIVRNNLNVLENRLENEPYSGKLLW